MTAIAWAIMSIGLIFYEAYDRKHIEEKGYEKAISLLTGISLFLLSVFTTRELFK